MQTTAPLISVILISRRMPALLARALQSVLAQTCDDLEAIVVVEDSDRQTLQALQSIESDKVKIKSISGSLTPGKSRNIAIQEARGEWIAFLDDQDEWRPEKLETQIQAAQQALNSHFIFSCRLTGRLGGKEFIWPRRIPGPSEPLSEYLFCQKSPLWGSGVIKLSTLLVKKELCQEIPFNENLQRHEDLDWLLRATSRNGTQVEFVSNETPLVTWHLDESICQRVAPDWQYTFSWIQENRALMTARAYVSFLLANVTRSAIQKKDWKAFWPILKEACQKGKPTILGLAMYFALWLIPENLKRSIAHFLTPKKNKKK